MVNEQMAANFGHFVDTSSHFTTVGLIEIFIHHATETPEHLAIVTPERVLSYGELAQQAQNLAAHLRQRGVVKETPVAILIEPGIEQIICQVAILLAGGSCVPLEPAMPDERLCFMLQDLGVDLTLIPTAAQQRDLPTQFLIFDRLPSFNDDALNLPKEPLGEVHRTHVLFTSGTTGRPKAVEIEARSIIRLVVNTHYIDITAADRIAGIASSTFDASLFEVWGALLNGASVVVLPKNVIVDPELFDRALQRFSVNIMFITTALFNLMANERPEIFGGLRCLLMGGEVSNPLMLRKVLQTAPPRQLICAYGPTENTTFSMIYEVTLADLDSDNVPIGHPIDNTQAFILDERQRPVVTGIVGNIYLAGEGLARGYWNRPDVNAQRFVMLDIHQDNQYQRFYDTGDLGWQRHDGAFMFAGRTDNQIKIRGHRIEVEEVEIQLLESRQLRSATVCVVRKEGAEPYLVGFIVPESPQSFVTADMTRWLEQRLPVYMLPRLVVIEAPPLTANGKVDRSRLLAEYTQSSQRQTSDQQDVSFNEEESLCLRIWQQILDVHTITLDDDFFRSGGSSLQAARLVIEIGRKAGQRIPVQSLYDAPTPRKFALNLRQETQQQYDLCSVMLKDGELPADIRALSQPVQPWLNAQSGRVLLTGATGFLGAFFLRDLLLRADINRVTCLVRAQDDAHALQRVQKNLAEYGLWQDAFMPRLNAIASDLAQPQLALDALTYERLAGECDVIFHLAAHVNYIQPYSAHYSGNITATQNVLRFAVHAKAKPLHYVSTIAAFGPAGLLTPVNTVYEDDDILPYLEGLRYDSGYSQSQWVVERIMWQARDAGVPLAIYRPGFIMGDSVSGAGNPKDFVARLIKGCIQVGGYPQLHRQRKEFVPVNYVSAALLKIACDNNNLGKAYHLVPPDNKQSTDLNPFFALLSQCGYSLQALSYSEWIAQLESDPQLDENPLMPLLPMLSEIVYEGLTRWEVYENMPVYDVQNAVNALVELPALFTPMDAELLQRYLIYWQRSGFLPTLDSQ